MAIPDRLRVCTHSGMSTPFALAVPELAPQPVLVGSPLQLLLRKVAAVDDAGEPIPGALPMLPTVVPAKLAATLADARNKAGGDDAVLFFPREGQYYCLLASDLDAAPGGVVSCLGVHVYAVPPPESVTPYAPPSACDFSVTF